MLSNKKIDNGSCSSERPVCKFTLRYQDTQGTQVADLIDPIHGGNAGYQNAQKLHWLDALMPEWPDGWITSVDEWL